MITLMLCGEISGSDRVRKGALGVGGMHLSASTSIGLSELTNPTTVRTTKEQSSAMV